jgi:hypothetical protein
MIGGGSAEKKGCVASKVGKRWECPINRDLIIDIPLFSEHSDQKVGFSFH